MPRPPATARTSETLSSRVFSGLAAKAKAMRAAGRAVHALSVGDTYREPPEAGRIDTKAYADLFKYSPVQGEPVLLEAIARRLERLGSPVPVERLQVMSGATAGLSVVASALFDPGDEVLLPAPFWPLIRGILAGRGAVPVQIPLFDRLASIDVEATFEAAVTERTAAVYVNTPHNPTSKVLPAEVVDAILRVAKRHDLWVLTDEAYQDLWLGDAPPRPVWTHPDAADRYVSCHTLSKSYGLAGARVGYTHGTEAAMRAIVGVQTFTTYCAPRPMQRAAAHVLDAGDEWLAARREEYGRMGRLAAEALGVAAPAGGTFLLFDATPHMRDGEMDAMPFLERCLEAGVLLTPGASCGEDYGSWVRLCFTGLPEDELVAALEKLRTVL